MMKYSDKRYQMKQNNRTQDWINAQIIMTIVFFLKGFVYPTLHLMQFKVSINFTFIMTVWSQNVKNVIKSFARTRFWKKNLFSHL